MFDHITLTVKDLKTSILFYDAVLSELRIERFLGGDEMGFIGFKHVDASEKDRGRFFLSQQEDDHATSTSMHIAFRAETREQVKEFYKKALELGAKDNGAPGVRSEYAEDYFAAFVLDADGNNIEVVSFGGR